MEYLETNLTILNFVIALIFLIAFMSIIAFIEGKTKAKNLFYNQQDNLVVTALILFIGIFVIFAFIKSSAPTFYSSGTFGFLVLMMKVLIAFFVSSKAKELGRNKILWWILSFLEFHIALIVLSQSKKLLNLKSEPKMKVKELNKSTNSKIDAIKKSTKDGIISENAQKQKISELESEYKSELEIIVKETEINNANSKLEYALKNGVITEDEYLRKKQTAE